MVSAFAIPVNEGHRSVAEYHINYRFCGSLPTRSKASDTSGEILSRALDSVHLPNCPKRPAVLLSREEIFELGIWNHLLIHCLANRWYSWCNAREHQQGVPTWWKTRLSARQDRQPRSLSPRIQTWCQQSSKADVVERYGTRLPLIYSLLTSEDMKMRMCLIGGIVILLIVIIVPAGMFRIFKSWISCLFVRSRRNQALDSRLIWQLGHKRQTREQ